MDRHRFDADLDPDLTIHFDADPDPDPNPSCIIIHMLENQKINQLSFTALPGAVGVIIFSIVDSILQFFGKSIV